MFLFLSSTAFGPFPTKTTQTISSILPNITQSQRRNTGSLECQQLNPKMAPNSHGFKPFSLLLFFRPQIMQTLFSSWL